MALAVALAFLALQAVAGFPGLSGGDDNDSLVRLVEVRDLIGGQGWFDLNQYRMGLDGGFAMHWSRLVDAPIAVIVLVVTYASGSAATGETVALVMWPILLFFVALYFILRTVRLLFGPETLLPAVFIGAASLHYTAIFVPGALDHHNFQLVLVLAMLFFLTKASRSNSRLSGVAAGVCTAMLLGVAMEAAPYVAVAGLVVALWFLVAPVETWRMASAFGLGFGGAATAIFAATVSSDSWQVAACDAYSLPQFSGAAVSGLGLAALAASPALRARTGWRIASLVALGLLAAVLVAMFFPQCLGDPYAGLDPRLKLWWLDAVTEAQPFWKLLLVSPDLAAGRYGPPLVALFCLAVAPWPSPDRRAVSLLAVLLGTAVLVSLWQVRGSVFSIPLAAMPLAGFVAAQRRQSLEKASAWATASMVAAWLVSFNVVWSAAVDGLAAVTAPARHGPAGELPSLAGDCLDAADFERLAGMPKSTVVTISNLGAPVLRYTPHRVLAGPYHRNVEGNLATLDIFTGPADEASEVAHRNGVTVVAICRGNGESRLLARGAPDGLMAALLSGAIPDWLQIVPESRDEALQLYRTVSMN